MYIYIYWQYKLRKPASNDISNIFDASKEIKNISNILGGKGGGGRKDLAQGGGSDISQIQNCLEYIEKKLISINWTKIIFYSTKELLSI